MSRLGCALAAAVALMMAGCATRPAVPVDDIPLRAHEAVVAQQPVFALRGRIGVSNGRNAGSASFVWEQDGDDLRFSLSVPLSGASWRLSGRPGDYVLDDGKGKARRGASAQDLLFDASGWLVPVDALGYWVRAARAPRDRAQFELDGDGRLKVMQQRGWTIRYSRYDELGLPRKLEAKRDNYSVRLSIRSRGDA